ncbi:MAG: anthranilate synthase component I family protein [Verrucomicrobiota bacterium]|nr:anthranilate synthase component I family protein [Verrucomicrobiota bacterium]
MIFPNEQEYATLAAGHDIVPVYKEVLADMDTPVSLLQRLADRPNAFLLESMEGGETWGRYSFVGIDPEFLFEANHSAGPTGDLAALRKVYQGLRVAEIPGLPRFFGGAVGYIGYEAVGEFEQMPKPKPSASGVVPRSRFLEVDRIIVFDNVRHTIKVVVSTRPREGGGAGETYWKAVAEVEKLSGLLGRPAAAAAAPVYPAVRFESNMAPEDYLRMVARAKDYIVAGDIIQAVLSQRFSAKTDTPAVQIYRALRFMNPSPYTFFLKMGDQALAGSSPEVMVRLTGNRVELRPIAGTRPRGKTEQQDRELADELLADEKEKAEHVMLVDLGRNDIGRIAESGSVQVTEHMVVERYSHVMHLVSRVEGILRKEFDAHDVIRATFPAGTLSGAPKIRAMEIIRELEPEPRGVYGGAVGYVSYSGNMDLAITIRTIEIGNGTVAAQAGAGIVYDSDPRRELEETRHKFQGMRRAIEMAARGLEVR